MAASSNAMDFAPRNSFLQNQREALERWNATQINSTFGRLVCSESAQSKLFLQSTALAADDQIAGMYKRETLFTVL